MRAPGTRQLEVAATADALRLPGKTEFCTTAQPTHVGHLPSQVRSQSAEADFAQRWLPPPVGAVSNRQLHSASAGASLVELLLVLLIGGTITVVVTTAVLLLMRGTARHSSQLVGLHDLQVAATWLAPDVNAASSVNVISDTEMVLTIPDPASTLTRTVTYTLISSELRRQVSGQPGLPVARAVDVVRFQPLGAVLLGSITVTLVSRTEGITETAEWRFAMRPTSASCQDLSTENTLAIALKNVDWGITNGGSQQRTLTGIWLDWPAANSCLAAVDWGGSNIWPDGSGPDCSPPTTIASDWKANGDRTIAAGATRTLQFDFSNNADPDPSAYHIRVVFDDGCVASYN